MITSVRRSTLKTSLLTKYRSALVGNALTPPVSNSWVFAGDQSGIYSTFNAGTLGFQSTPATIYSFGVASGYGLAINSSKTAIAVGARRSSTATQLGAIRWNNTTKTIGTAYTSVTAGSSSGTGRVAFAPNNASVAVASSQFGTTPYIYAYAWTDAAGYGTKYANPSTLPATAFSNVPQMGIAFNSTSTAIATTGSDFSSVAKVYVYPWSASGFGTKYANAATNITTEMSTVQWNSAGNVLLVAGAGSPYVNAYVWSSGFGSKYANPATAITSQVNDARWNSAGTQIVLATQNSPYVHGYAWSSGFGSKYANPATLPTGITSSVTFANSGASVYFGNFGAARIVGYPWSASGFGTQYTIYTGTLSPIYSLTTND